MLNLLQLWIKRKKLKNMIKWFVSIFRRAFSPFRDCDKWARSEQKYNERILVGEPQSKSGGSLHAVLDDVTKNSGSIAKYRDRYGKYSFNPLISNSRLMTLKKSKYEMDNKNSTT